MFARALTPLIFAASLSAASQSPDELLRLAQDAFLNPSGYEFHGGGLFQPDGSSWDVKFSVDIAAEPAPLETPRSPVNPGVRAGGPFQYEMAGQGDASHSNHPSINIPFSVIGGWTKIALNVDSIKEIGTERLPLNGSMTDCRLLNVLYRPQTDGIQPAQIRYSICSDQHLVLKKVMNTPAGPRPNDLGGSWAVTFDAVQFHHPPPEWLVDLKSLPETKSRSEWLGKRAPNFHLKDLSGETVALTELRGRPVLLDFWSTSCAPCIRDLPNVKRLAEEHKVEVAVWGISFDQPDRDKKWLTQHQEDFPTLSDTEFEVSDLYKIEGIPALVLIDSGGIIRGFWEGEVSFKDVEDALKATLAHDRAPKPGSHHH